MLQVTTDVQCLLRTESCDAGHKDRKARMFIWPLVTSTIGHMFECVRFCYPHVPGFTLNICYRQASCLTYRLQMWKNITKCYTKVLQSTYDLHLIEKAGLLTPVCTILSSPASFTFRDCRSKNFLHSKRNWNIYHYAKGHHYWKHDHKIVHTLPILPCSTRNFSIPQLEEIFKWDSPAQRPLHRQYLLRAALQHQEAL